MSYPHCYVIYILYPYFNWKFKNSQTFVQWPPFLECILCVYYGDANKVCIYLNYFKWVREGWPFFSMTAFWLAELCFFVDKPSVQSTLQKECNYKAVAYFCTMQLGTQECLGLVVMLIIRKFLRHSIIITWVSFVQSALPIWKGYVGFGVYDCSGHVFALLAGVFYNRQKRIVINHVKKFVRTSQ